MLATERLDPTYVVFDKILAAAAGTAFEVAAGQVLRIIDVEGKQVPDLLCFDSSDYSDKLSPPNTQLINQTIFLKTGHHLYSTRCRPLMTILEDTCGVHDIISGACSSYTNAFRYGVRGTPSCRTNFEEALRPYGIPEREIPYNLNIFMNVTVAADGSTQIEEPKSKAGDYIDLVADTDVLVAISNCPQSRNPCNGWNPSPLRLILHEPQAREGEG
jgi:urea carboxylase-associated protein 1